MAEGALEAALPREMYVDQQAWLTEREAVLFGQWFCVGRADDLGLAESSKVVVVDVVGESVLVTSDERGHLHGAYNVCRHRGAQLRPVEEQPARTRLVAALPLPLVDLRPRRLGCSGARTRLTVEDPSAFGLHPVGVETWQGSCSCT